MEFIKSVNKSIQMRRTDGVNGFWCLWGDIERNKDGEYFYTEYVKDGEIPRSININNCAEEVKKYLISEISQ